MVTGSGSWAPVNALLPLRAVTSLALFMAKSLASSWGVKIAQKGKLMCFKHWIKPMSSELNNSMEVRYELKSFNHHSPE
jgi:hypothetical protein